MNRSSSARAAHEERASQLLEDTGCLPCEGKKVTRVVPAVTHLIAIAALLLAAAVSIAAGFGGGADRFFASLLAALVVFCGLAVGRLFFLWKSQGKADISGVLLGMLARIAAPAIAWIVCQVCAPHWMASGFAESLLLLYLIGLFAETMLIVQTIPRYRPRQNRLPVAETPATNA